MTTKKKTATTTEAATPAVKAAPVKKTTKTATPEVKAKATPSAAATHKAPARKSAAPKTEVAAAAVRTPSFDENAYRTEIEREAYLLWERRGYSHGQAHEDWICAVEVVRARYAN